MGSCRRGTSAFPAACKDPHQLFLEIEPDIVAATKLSKGRAVMCIGQEKKLGTILPEKWSWAYVPIIERSVTALKVRASRPFVSKGE